MTTDFKATQVQTNKIIVTGSFAGDGSNQLLIYNYDADDSGSPNQGQIDPTKFDTTSGIGSDVFLFVSGGVATRGTGGSYGVTVMGGDLHVSGNLTVDGTSPGGGGGGGNDYWQSTEIDVIFNTGSIRQGTNVIIDSPAVSSIIFSSDNNARVYGGVSNAIISSYGTEVRNTPGDLNFPDVVSYNTIVSDIYSVIDGEKTAFNTQYNLIGAGAGHLIESGSAYNAILGSAYVNISSGSILNTVLATSDFPNPTVTTIYKTINSAIIAGGPNIISSSDGIPLVSSAIIGCNWTITSSRTYAIGDTVYAAQVLISASNGVEITAPVRIIGSLAQGDSSNTVGSSDSHAEGVFTNAQAAGSHAEGSSALSSGDYSHAEGYYTTASVDYAHAEGERTEAAGQGSHAEGFYTYTGGDYSHAEGERTRASGYASHAEGYLTTASADYSHAEGYFTTAQHVTNMYMHAEGYLTVASGEASHAEGNSSTASGQGSHAEGTICVASGPRSHAEGYNTKAQGFQSHSEGESTIADNTAAHAEGKSTFAGAQGSHTEGFLTRVDSSGDFSHAEGHLTTGSGLYSHAEGSGSISFGNASHAQGIFTIASGSGQAVLGKYNLRNNNFSLFVIGDGTGDANANRSDIVRVNSGTLPGSGSFEVTGTIRSTLGFSGSLTQLTDGTPYLIAGTGIQTSTGSNGAVTISSTGGGGGLATGKQYVAPYTTTTSTTPIAAGQFSWVPADYTGLTSVTVRAIMSTDGTANHTGSLQVYNLTSGSYLDLLDTPASSKHFIITSSIPTLVTSSNLLTGITNFNNSSTSVYEVRVSGSLASSTFIGGVELVFG